MSELTKEYFEQTLKAALTAAVAPLATKTDVRDAVEELARITSSGFARTGKRFDELESRLDVADQIKTFGLSAGIGEKCHSTRLSWFSEKRRIRCWSRPYASLSIGDSACSYSRGRG